MNEIKVFENKEFGQVRTMVIDGEPWFVGKDVCIVFGDKNHNRSLGRVDSVDRQSYELIDSLGRKQTATLVNESGLYSLLFAMQPQKAHNNGVSDEYLIEIKERIEKLHKFKRWVTAEVLPTIRKTGGYVNDEDLFVNTYLPFADDNTKNMFGAILSQVRQQNVVIAQQKQEIAVEKKNVERKTKVITGLTKDMPVKDKRTIINEVLRHGGEGYKERWDAAYDLFNKTYHMNVTTRYNNYMANKNNKRCSSKLDYVDKILHMIPEFYNSVAQLYEGDIKALIDKMYSIIGSDKS